MRGRGRVRFWLVAGLAWAGAVGCAAWSLVRLLGAEWGSPAIQLIAFTPYVAVAAFIGAAACLAVGQRVPALIALAASVALASVVAPRALDDGDQVRDGAPLRVLSVNMRLGAADRDAIVDLARRTRADLLAVQELTPGAQRELEAAGLRASLPYASLHAVPGSHGSALYSRHPMKDLGVRRHDSGFSQAMGEVTVPGIGALLVESAHPCAPIGPSRDDCWFDDLADQPTPTAGGPLRVLLGDFNATLDHAPMRALLDAGYRDAAAGLGEGLRATWPSDRWPPGVTLDRVLVGPGIGIRAYQVHPIIDSDHRAVFAVLVLPKR